jgi:hypothetical protein
VVQPPFDKLFAISRAVRYVAFADGQEVASRQREGIEAASASASDRFEELLVNPTLVTLARQRGEIDCGGLEFLVVGYGNFRQLVVPLERGHVSIAFELDAEPLDHLESIRSVLERTGGHFAPLQGGR